MVTRVAQYWSYCLPESSRDALHETVCILCDSFLGESEQEERSIVDLLPSGYRLRYTEAFLRSFFVTLLTVAYKLAQPTPPTPLLSCMAETLALHVLVAESSALLEERGIEPQFGDFEDEVYEDLDHEYLYRPEFDGIEDSEVGAAHGIGHLSFDEWFEPFRNASTAVHPYCQGYLSGNADAEALTTGDRRLASDSGQ